MVININISYYHKYLICFTANNAHGLTAGDVGCFYGLSLNGSAPISETISDKDSRILRRPFSIVKIDNIPAGTIPITNL